MEFSSRMREAGRTPAQIRCEIDKLVANQDCTRSCIAFKQEIETYQGASTAAELVDRAAASTGP